jgi:hypothetical protein
MSFFSRGQWRSRDGCALSRNTPLPLQRPSALFRETAATFGETIHYLWGDDSLPLRRQKTQ